MEANHRSKCQVWERAIKTPQEVVISDGSLKISLVPGVGESNPPEPSPAPMNASLMDLQLTRDEMRAEARREVRRRAHFYVYCDAPSCRFVPSPVLAQS